MSWFIPKLILLECSRSRNKGLAKFVRQQPLSDRTGDIYGAPGVMTTALAREEGVTK
jgi:hypothetical protein